MKKTKIEKIIKIRKEKFKAKPLFTGEIGIYRNPIILPKERVKK